MDNIADSVFTETAAQEELVDNPSLLTVVLELTPKSWAALASQAPLQEITKALVVFLNAHLSLNNSNQVAFLVSLNMGARFLHPAGGAPDIDDHAAATFVNPGMYRQFRLVDEAVFGALNRELLRLAAAPTNDGRSSLAGALLMALTYTNRMQRVDQSINTTAALAISAAGQSGGGGSGSAAAPAMDARVLVVTANDTYDNNYIGIMNTIFAAQKMKVAIDVAKLGNNSAPYLQQAADATNGVYLHVAEPQGMVQTLATAFFVEPLLRLLVILPTLANVDYKALCFLTGRAVDVGYVCSVCLCIMSMIPEGGTCPTCQSKFDEKYVARLKRGPVLRKKRRVEERADGERGGEKPREEKDD